MAVVSPHSSSRSALKCSSSRRSLRCWPPIESTRRSSVGCLDLQWRLAPRQFDSAKPDRLSMLPGGRIRPDDHAPSEVRTTAGRGRASNGWIADGCGCDGCDSNGNQQGRGGQHCCLIAAGDRQRFRRRRSAGRGAARVRRRHQRAEQEVRNFMGDHFVMPAVPKGMMKPDEGAFLGYVMRDDATV